MAKNQEDRLEKQRNVRIQLDMSQEKIEKLDEFFNSFGLSTRKEYFEQSLNFFIWALKEMQAGRIVASIDEKENKCREAILPGIIDYISK